MLKLIRQQKYVLNTKIQFRWKNYSFPRREKFGNQIDYSVVCYCHRYNQIRVYFSFSKPSKVIY